MFKNVFVKMQMKDSKKFLAGLEAMDSDEIGLVVALAAHFKNKYLERGIDLSHPIQMHIENPLFVVELINDVKALQKRNMEILAPGDLVWIASLRAANDLKLRAIARKVWGQLERGFPYAEAASNYMLEQMGFELNILNFDKFPDGLTPEPL